MLKNHKQNYFKVFAVLSLALFISACATNTEVRGYRFDFSNVEIPQGMSKEELVLTVGSPSTTATFDGDETYYYISQTKKVTSFRSQKLIDQRVLAVTFDKNDRVKQVSDYGIKDGQVFDFINRRTPTAGKQTTFIRQIFTNLLNE